MARGTRYWLALVFPFIFALFTLTVVSAGLGWDIGRTDRNLTATAIAALSLDEQYALAVLDIEEGRQYVALQRLEYIFSQDADFRDAADLWIEISLQVGAVPEATQAQGLPSPTVTPTIDPRPKEELFAKAEGHMRNGEWSQAIDTLLALRQSDPSYQFADVDGMLYAALINRGGEKILNEGNFEGGLFDFALAENFGPLDYQSSNYRGWARLYLQGNAFWLAYPEIAADYYGQLAGAAPGLTDASGFSSFYRYWLSLVHIGDHAAAADEWCQAVSDYQTALAARQDASIQATADYSQSQCNESQVTDTPTSTLTLAISLTPTVTFTPGGATLTPTSTNTQAPGNTSTFTVTPTVTATPVPGNTATFTPTPTNTVPAHTATNTLVPTLTNHTYSRPRRHEHHEKNFSVFTNAQYSVDSGIPGSHLSLPGNPVPAAELFGHAQCRWC